MTRLTGRGGPDIFVFDTVPNTTANRDIIADFNGVQDTIRLAKSAFTALTGNAGTTLSADQFVIGADALDANDRIIYSNGTLIYDHNGNVAGGEQLIAVLVRPADAEQHGYCARVRSRKPASCFVRRMLVAMSAHGPSRHAARAHEFGRKRRKADMQVVAPSNRRGAYQLLSRRTRRLFFGIFHQPLRTNLSAENVAHRVDRDAFSRTGYRSFFHGIGNECRHFPTLWRCRSGCRAANRDCGWGQFLSRHRLRRSRRSCR